MKIGDVVVISKGNHIVDAIGVVKSDYYFDDNQPIEYVHFRDVEWIATNMNVHPERFISKNISMMTIYEFYPEDIKLVAFKELTNSSSDNEKKNYVLIIDEINRGNVSQIFGELITLIEDDKRLGAENELKITLPYSKEKFGVPKNLYIIGTMNTADRSVEALDTALRRRFSFVEMMPDYDVIPESIDGVKLPELLQMINQRIEALLDRDHQIGHSYFIGVKDLQGLKRVFKDKIIPLLQEYFYGSYDKIGMVLGEGFIKKDNDMITFADGFNSNDYEIAEKYSINPDWENNFSYALGKLGIINTVDEEGQAG